MSNRIYKKRITIYDIDRVMILLLVIINCRGFRLLLPSAFSYSHITYYNFFTIYSILELLLTLIVGSGKKYNNIIIYFLLVLILFFLPQYFYTAEVYSQTLKALFENTVKFFYFFWSVPIIHVISKDRTPEKLLTTISIVVLIGYILVAINATALNTMGFSIINSSYFSSRGDFVRLVDISSFVPVAVIYFWSRVLAHQKKSILPLGILICCILYCERTRALIIAVIGSMAIMFLFKRRDNINKYLVWIIFVLILFVSVIGGLWSIFFSQFSIENNGVSTINRLTELDFYYRNFKNNIFFGIGAISDDIFIGRFGFSSRIMNYEDVGIVGLLGNYGLTSIVLFIGPLILWIYVYIAKKKLIYSKDVFLGMIFYSILSMPTLAMINLQRIPLFVLFFSLFEYYHFKRIS